MVGLARIFCYRYIFIVGHPKEDNHSSLKRFIHIPHTSQASEFGYIKGHFLSKTTTYICVCIYKIFTKTASYNFPQKAQMKQTKLCDGHIEMCNI